MKNAPPGLAQMLVNAGINAQSFVFCDNYTFTLTGGQVLRYTTCDTDVKDVTLRNATFSSKGPFFDTLASKSQAHWKTGLDVDTWQVHITPLAKDPVTGAPFPATIGSQPWLAAVIAGALRGATVDIDRAYWANGWPKPWKTPLVPDYVLGDVFAGRVAAVDVMAPMAIISINSHLELFSTGMPLNLFQSACRHTLFDAGCTLLQASFAWTPPSGALSGSTQARIAIPPGTPANYNFALGQIVWTTGANAGFARQIKKWDPSSFTLIAPMPFPVAAGDLFTAYPGCDKSTNTCQNVFGNLANFGGTPNIPAPETAV